MAHLFRRQLSVNNIGSRRRRRYSEGPPFVAADGGGCAATRHPRMPNRSHTTELRMAHVGSQHEDPGARTDSERGAVLSLGLLSIAVGAWTGLVVAIFRLGLAEADRLR